MAIELSERAAVAYLRGDNTAELAAGKHLKIETSPQGDELLDYTVPEGKTASVTVYVEVQLSDA